MTSSQDWKKQLLEFWYEKERLGIACRPTFEEIYPFVADQIAQAERRGAQEITDLFTKLEGFKLPPQDEKWGSSVSQYQIFNDGFQEAIYRMKNLLASRTLFTNRKDGV